MLLWFIFYSGLITLAYSYPLLAIQKFIRNKENEGKRTDNWDLYMCVFFILVNYSAIMYLSYSMAYSVEPLRFFYLNFISIPMLILWGFIFVSSVISAKKPNLLVQKRKKAHWDELKIDIRRKVAHIVFYVLLWIGLYVYMAVVIQQPVDPEPYLVDMWEYNPNNPDALFKFLQLLEAPARFEDIGYTHMLMVLIFAIAHYCFIMFEVIRHSKTLWSPTNLLVRNVLREEEVNSFATYFQFFLSMTLSSIILPPLLTFAVVAVSLFGDLLASQFGMRWGKYSLPLNKKKTWTGLFAGTIGSYLISSILVGPVYGFFASAIFFLTDFLTPKPIKISDNLLNPLLITIVFILLNVMGIPYDFPNFLIL